jgi:hypothetical protein
MRTVNMEGSTAALIRSDSECGNLIYWYYPNLDIFRIVSIRPRILQSKVGILFFCNAAQRTDVARDNLARIQPEPDSERAFSETPGKAIELA